MTAIISRLKPGRNNGNPIKLTHQEGYGPPIHQIKHSFHLSPSERKRRSQEESVIWLRKTIIPKPLYEGIQRNRSENMDSDLFMFLKRPFFVTIPSQFGLSLSNSETLDFSLNHLSGSIPKSIGNLSKLSYLDISQNSLSRTIPTEITQLFWKPRLSERLLPERERITWEGEILGYTGGFSPGREMAILGC
ncbi:hypothetical protein Lal_00032954 [Lupinus albus]|nr:hypothetical protein Lal_00032954 [Lupinus albus]